MRAAHDFRAGLRGALERFERAEADVVHEEGQLLGVVAVRVPAEAVVAAHADAPAGLEDFAIARRAAFERFLMAVNHALRQAELLPTHDARLLEVKPRHHGHVALQEQLQPLVINERRVLD